MIIFFILILIYSLYMLLISNDAFKNGVGLLRVMLAILGIATFKFNQEVVLAISALLFTIAVISSLAITRSEVQFKK